MSDGTHRLSPPRRWHCSSPLPTMSSIPEYLVPKSIAAVREVASLIAAAEWAPSPYRDLEGRYVVDRIALAIMHGAAVGLGPFAAVQSIAVIDGLPTIWGDGAMALVEHSGLIEDRRENYVIDDEEGLTAICTISRRQRPTPITGRFSTAMADQARLTQKEGPWQSYPRRMLMMRARSWALRDGFADVLRGLSIREEVEDFANAAISRPEPVLAVSPLRPPITAGRVARRPRFADHVRREPATERAPSEADQSFVADHSAASLHPSEARTHEVTKTAATGDPHNLPIPEGAAPPNDPSSRSIYSDASVLSPAQGPKIDEAEDGVAADVGLVIVDEGAADSIDTAATSSRVEGTTPVSAADETSFALIDAEGAFVEVTNIVALRDAFACLFADPYLSADQVLGLWESNETARAELEQAFGATALSEADSRRTAAERHGVSQASVRPKAAPRAGRSRSKRAKIAKRGSDIEAIRPLKIDPARSDETALRRYRTHLSALKRRRAMAATFVDFRRANHEIEERLRKSLPHLMTDIDAIFAWAANHAR
jgi:hypothetical protein